ncbi:DUF2281 domain-containing protein [Cohnella fermenti]|uniref:DUF2281 domain-containing protein n=1 Tax=Cohnella fermenti TaxID=2565925 RepID=A0A4S4BG28_9BACL|nr:DUF2281 domain-containing protein [Cohnella fermenti]
MNNWWIFDTFQTTARLPGQGAIEVADFIGYLNAKREREALKNLEYASLTSMEFWNNSVDDEVWNNV